MASVYMTRLFLGAMSTPIDSSMALGRKGEVLDLSFHSFSVLSYLPDITRTCHPSYLAPETFLSKPNPAHE